MKKAFRGDLEVPLPDDHQHRATMFAELSSAWSLLLSTVDDIWDRQQARPVSRPVLEPEVPKPNGKHIGRPRGAKNKKRRKRGAGR